MSARQIRADAALLSIAFVWGATFVLVQGAIDTLPLSPFWPFDSVLPPSCCGGFSAGGASIDKPLQNRLFVPVYFLVSGCLWVFLFRRSVCCTRLPESPVF